MADSILKQIIGQHMKEPGLIGSLACHLYQNEPMTQQHRDGREFEVYWRQLPGYWRCTVFIAKESEDCIAQIDLHDDQTVRMEAHEPISVTIDPKLNILALVRFSYK
jgi:hypothetical protein